MDKVRIGLIGTSGWVEQMYVPSLRSHPGAEVVAVCGRNPVPAGDDRGATRRSARLCRLARDDRRRRPRCGDHRRAGRSSPRDGRGGGRGRAACDVREAPRQHACRGARHGAGGRGGGRRQPGAFHLALAAALALRQAPRRGRVISAAAIGRASPSSNRPRRGKATSGASTAGGRAVRQATSART